jgi:hypothetical protein
MTSFAGVVRAINANKKAACNSSGEMLPPLGLGASNTVIGSLAPMPLKEAHSAATTSDPSLVHRHNDFVEWASL